MLGCGPPKSVLVASFVNCVYALPDRVVVVHVVTFVAFELCLELGRGAE